MASSSRTGKNLSLFTPKKQYIVKIIMNDVMKNQKLASILSILSVASFQCFLFSTSFLFFQVLSKI
jgi:hypothetical protein